MEKQEECCRQTEMSDCSIGIEDLKNRFACYKPDERKAIRHENIRNIIHGCVWLVKLECPESHERSIAISKLEEAIMWVNAALPDMANIE